MNKTNLNFNLIDLIIYVKNNYLFFIFTFLLSMALTTFVYVKTNNIYSANMKISSGIPFYGVDEIHRSQLFDQWLSESELKKENYPTIEYHKKNNIFIIKHSNKIFEKEVTKRIKDIVFNSINNQNLALDKIRFVKDDHIIKEKAQIIFVDPSLVEDSIIVTFGKVEKLSPNIYKYIIFGLLATIFSATILIFIKDLNKIIKNIKK